jgi:WD40 repeat protein
MSWPLSQDYNEAIQDPATSFADAELRRGEPTLNALGLPWPRSGNFADVYEVTCHASGDKWAVKCFTRQVHNQAARYRLISRHLEAARLPFTVDFQYLTQGIRIHGQWYPILKMRWVEGLLLNEFVRTNLDKPALLHALGQIWLRMSRRLCEVGVGHCDLQHGNVILVPGSKTQSLAVKLIDYDGMYVPALAGKKSGEVGHPNYQHPQRLRDGTYGPEVDCFSILVVATALRALELEGEGLWQCYDNGDNLLFKETDLRDPAGSALFSELRQMPDPLLKTMVGRLEQACKVRLEEVPVLAALFPEERPTAVTPVPPPLPPHVAVQTLLPASYGPDWSEVAAEPMTPRGRRRTPAWAWAMAAGLAVSLAAVGGFFALGGASDKPLAPDRARADTSPAVEKVSPAPEEKKLPDDKPPPAEARLRFLPGSTSLLAILDGDKSWRLYDTLAHKEVRHLNAAQGPISCLAVTPDRRRAVGGAGKLVCIWDLEKGSLVAVLAIHQWPVMALAVSPDGTRAVSADGGTSPLLLDLAAGTVLRRFVFPRGVTAAAFSPDGKLMAFGTGGDDGPENPIFVCDAQSGQQVRHVAGHPKAINCLAFWPKGNRLISAGRDGVVRLWYLRRRSEEGQVSGLPQDVQSLTLSPDGNKLLIESDHVARVVDLLSKKDVGGLQVGPGQRICCCFEPDGSQLVTCTLGADGSIARGAASINRDAAADRQPPSPDAADRWRHLDISEATDKGEYLHLEPWKWIPTRRRYTGSIDITVKARTTKNNIRLTAGDGGRLIFNWEVRTGALRVHRPDDRPANGRGVNGGSFAGERMVPLTPNQWYTLRWQLTADGMKVWVNGSLVFETAERYDLSNPRPVAVCSFECPIDVQSVSVKELPGEKDAGK